MTSETYIKKARELLEQARMNNSDHPIGLSKHQEMLVAELFERIDGSPTEKEHRINAARQRKIARLLALFWKHDLKPSQVRKFRAGQWETAAKAAGIHSPSEITRALLWAHFGEVADS